MNIERRMDFIVENLAALTFSQQRTDRQILALQKLVKTGMQMLVNLNQKTAQLAVAQRELAMAQREMAVTQKELAAAQLRTDEKFERWLDSINKGANGHKRKPN